MPIGEVYQNTVVNLQNAEPCASVFYNRVVEDAGTTDPEKDQADALIDGIITHLADMQWNQVQYECVLSRRILPTTQPARVILQTLNGALGGQELPANVAMSFRHYSLDASPFLRGRWFINGLLESWVENGRILATHATDVQPFINAVPNDYTVSGRTYRVMHYSRRLDTFYDIDSVIFNPVPTKVRNRTPGLCSIS
jgi:hypothetical protein